MSSLQGERRVILQIRPMLLRVLESVYYPRCDDRILNGLVDLGFDVCVELVVGVDEGGGVDEFLSGCGLARERE